MQGAGNRGEEGHIPFIPQSLSTRKVTVSSFSGHDFGGIAAIAVDEMEMDVGEEEVVGVEGEGEMEKEKEVWRSGNETAEYSSLARSTSQYYSHLGTKSEVESSHRLGVLGVAEGRVSMIEVGKDRVNLGGGDIMRLGGGVSVKVEEDMSGGAGDKVMVKVKDEPIGGKSVLSPAQSRVGVVAQGKISPLMQLEYRMGEQNQVAAAASVQIQVISV